jgi:Protein of unknown function (DUF742)
MTGVGERWMDRDAGPVVRPYALTRGRTRPAGAAPGLLDIVSALAIPAAEVRRGLGPEQRRLLELCRRPMAVADLASEIDLPLGVVRVLLGDLQEKGLVAVSGQHRTGSLEENVLRSVLDGLRAL